MSPDINLLPDELRRREREAPPVSTSPLMHEPAESVETPAPPSRRKDFFKLFHKSQEDRPQEVTSAEAPSPRKEVAVAPPQKEEPKEEPEKPKPETAWHDVPEEHPEEEPPQVDLIPGMVNSVGGLRLVMLFEAIGAVVLVIVILFAHLAINRSLRNVNQERLFENERIAALEARINEIEASAGNTGGAGERLQALEGRIAAHRDWRKLLDIVEHDLLPDVTLLQFRADEGGVVVVEARTSRVDVATAQARHLERALASVGKVALGDVRVVTVEGSPQPFVQFRLTLTLSQDFWIQ